VRVVVVSDDGTQRVDAVLPGGAYDTATKTGWRVSGSGRTWKFSTATPVNGIGKVTLTDKDGAKTPRGVKVSVKGKKGTYPVVGGDSPIKAIVTLGDPTAAQQGLCGESAYTAPDCVFNGSQNKR